MEVILRQDVTHVGRTGEIVKVKDGYARNFLLPQGIAFVASDANKKRVEAEKKRLSAKLEMAKADAEALAAKLENLTLTFTGKTGEGDRMFGSITTQEIAEKLAEAGHSIDKRIIELADPIKVLGDHDVKIKLHPDVQPGITVRVEKE
ncbi:MAG: 50S ribosomal protein L9 [Gemmatimonadota bacterium]|nr:50S ribosomal protein L9 [Gemmatimonadota bacterium]MDH5803734.1 50S ribosomal protein L9 [Gemmatimonadota bacterium]